MCQLNNFQVIEFWLDPETGYVYTLAIAKFGELIDNDKELIL